MIIETKRLILSQLSLQDVDFIYNLMNEESYIKGIGDRKISDQSKAEQYLRSGPLKSYQENEFGLLKVSLKKNLAPIGICGFLQRDYLEVPDIGYATSLSYQKQGYTFEAIRATLLFGRENLHFKKVMAITSFENEASINLLIKSGFKYSHTKVINQVESNIYTNDFNSKFL